MTEFPAGVAALGDADREPGTERIDLSRRTVAGGFFAWRRDAPERTPFAAAAGVPDGEPYRHCFTYAGGGSTIRRELIDIIDHAQRKIFVAALTLGDKDLRESLIRAAGRMSGGVYVISALDDKGLEEANEYDDDPDLDRQLEHRNFRELTRHGIYVRGYGGLHAKFVVVDDRIALVSSANLVTASFTTTGENGVIVTDRADVDTLARVFTRLWQLSPWDMPPDSRHADSIDQRTGAVTRVAAPRAAASGPGPIWTWEDREADHHIASTVVAVADTAQSDLDPRHIQHRQHQLPPASGPSAAGPAARAGTPRRTARRPSAPPAPRPELPARRSGGGHVVRRSRSGDRS